jgi:hypothetical protein
VPAPAPLVLSPSQSAFDPADFEDDIRLLLVSDSMVCYLVTLHGGAHAYVHLHRLIWSVGQVLGSRSHHLTCYATRRLLRLCSAYHSGENCGQG